MATTQEILERNPKIKYKELISTLYEKLCGTIGCPDCGNKNLNNFWIFNTQTSAQITSPKNLFRNTTQYG